MTKGLAMGGTGVQFILYDGLLDVLRDIIQEFMIAILHCF